MGMPAEKTSESPYLLSHDFTKNVRAHTLIVKNYQHEQTYGKVNHIINSNNDPCNINESHCHALTLSFRSYRYQYVRSTMTCYLSPAVIPEAPTTEMLCAEFARNSC